MPKLILDFIFTFGGMSLVAYYFYASTNWEKLSKKYSTKKKIDGSLFAIQELVYINKIAINRLNVGVSNEGLFLSFPSIMGLAFSSILIPWSELSYGQDVNNNSRVENFLLNIGNPKLASIQLSSNTIERIHITYGEPIFFERLGEPDV